MRRRRRPDPATQTVAFDVITPSKIFRVALGTAGDSGGDLQSASILTSGGFGSVATGLSNAWHTYTISAGPSDTSASLSIDGGTAIAMAGLSGTFSPAAEFGSFTNGNGYGEWAQVTLETNTIPEPSSIALLVSAMVGLLAYAWRKRR